MILSEPTELVMYLNAFESFFLDYTLESLTNTIATTLREYQRLGAISLDYHMRPKKLGGLAYAVKKYRRSELSWQI
jgi:hypothetical protein